MSNAGLQHGQSILEAILAMAIFAFMAMTMVALAVGGFTAIEQGSKQSEAEFLAEEGVEAVRAIRDRAWNENIYTTSSVGITGSQWVFSGEGTTETIGQFVRKISFESVCRDVNSDIAPCPALYTDVHGKKAVVTVSWDIRAGVSNTVRRETYITNWDTFDWREDVSADFSDGTFLNTEVSGTLGDGDGAVVLQQF